MTLRTRRSTLLQCLRRLDSETAIDVAAKHIALLNTAPWPRWLDMDAVFERAEERDEHRAMMTQRNRDLAWLEENDLYAALETWWQTHHRSLSYRFSTTGSDHHQFWQSICAIMLNCHLCLGDEDPHPTHFALVPEAEASLYSLFDIYVLNNDSIDTLRDIFYTFETGIMQAIIYDELGRNTQGLPVDEHMLGIAWRHALVKNLAARGSWLNTNMHRSVKSLMKSYGDGKYSGGLIAMMETVDALEKDIAKIGGNSYVQVMEEDRLHRFHRHPDGWYNADTTGWIRLSVRAALILAMTENGSLMVERMRDITNHGHIVRDTYAAALGEETYGWLSEQECRAVHHYSLETGKAMPIDPGKIYRGFYEDFG